MLINAPRGFRDVELCGTGATSRVFKAVQESTGTLVALKRMHKQRGQTPEALARLRRELEASSRLSHPAIVPVLDVIRWDGDPTIVMRYVPGEDLKNRILRSGPLDFAETERIARVLFGALGAAHAAGIVHRDVKPQNVRLGETGEIFLLDFGSARLDAASQLTRTGTTVGTPEYMPPELFAGSVYDPRVDIYGVGATLFECLVGRPAQTADSLAELAHSRCTRPIPAVSSLREGVPQHLAQVVDRALAIRAEDRYASASLAIFALDCPDPERISAAQRSSHPSCVECMTPIAAHSVVCPVCKRSSPFDYRPGTSHVEIHAVEEPVQFIEHVATLAPEQADDHRIAALSDHLAYLSFGKRRYLSFVDREDAERVAKELGRIGARAKATDEPRWGAWMLVVAAGAILMTTLLGAGVELAALFGCVVLLERALSFFRARQSMLSDSRLPSSIWPALQIGSALSSVSLIGLMFMFPENAGSLVIALLASVMGTVAASGAGIVRRAKPRGTPEPDLSQQVAGLTSLTGSAKKKLRELPGPRAISKPIRSLVMFSFLALVPLELGVVSEIGLTIAKGAMRPGAREFFYDGYGPFLYDPGRPVRGAVSRTLVDWPFVEESDIPDWLNSDVSPPVPTGAGSSSAPQSMGSSGAAAAPSLDPERFVAPLVELSPLALLGLFLALLVRRGRKLKRDAQAIRAELDPEKLARLASRQLPERSGQQRRRSTARMIASTPSVDGFVAAAVHSASDLVYSASEESAKSIAKLLNQLTAPEVRAAGRLAREKAENNALQQRCIMETDGDYRLRFQLLELLGRMEAEAAVKWAEELGREKK